MESDVRPSFGLKVNIYILDDIGNRTRMQSGSFWLQGVLEDCWRTSFNLLFCSTDQATDRLIDWLIIRSIGCLISRLIDWLIWFLWFPGTELNGQDVFNRRLGFAKFIKRADLLRPDSRLMPNGTLTLLAEVDFLTFSHTLLRLIVFFSFKSHAKKCLETLTSLSQINISYRESDVALSMQNSPTWLTADLQGKLRGRGGATMDSDVVLVGLNGLFKCHRTFLSGNSFTFDFHPL